MLSQWADKINVLYCGQTVETAPSKVGDDATSSLYPGADPRDTRLRQRDAAQKSPQYAARHILEQLPIGCRLGPRCPYAQRECIVTPRLTGAKNHLYACHFPLNMEKSEMIKRCEVRNLSKTFRYRTGWFRRQTVEAVKPLALRYVKAEHWRLLARMVRVNPRWQKCWRGIEPTSGELLIDDHPLHFGDYSFRSQRIRMIFQDPSTSLNPRRCISQILDFLRLNTDLEPEQRRKQIIETMRMVGLLPDPTSVTIRICWHPGKNGVWVWRADVRQKVIIT